MSSPQVNNGTCYHCMRTVYQMEAIIADGRLYHKGCFKCGECKRTLSLANYVSEHGIIYCHIHKPKSVNISPHTRGPNMAGIGAGNSTVDTESLRTSPEKYDLPPSPASSQHRRSHATPPLLLRIQSTTEEPASPTTEEPAKLMRAKTIASPTVSSKISKIFKNSQGGTPTTPVPPVTQSGLVSKRVQEFLAASSQDNLRSRAGSFISRPISSTHETPSSSHEHPRDSIERDSDVQTMGNNLEGLVGELDRLETEISASRKGSAKEIRFSKLRKSRAATENNPTGFVPNTPNAPLQGNMMGRAHSSVVSPSTAVSPSTPGEDMPDYFWRSNSRQSSISGESDVSEDPDDLRSSTVRPAFQFDRGDEEARLPLKVLRKPSFKIGLVSCEERQHEGPEGLQFGSEISGIDPAAVFLPSMESIPRFNKLLAKTKPKGHKSHTSIAGDISFSTAVSQTGTLDISPNFIMGLVSTIKSDVAEICKRDQNESSRFDPDTFNHLLRCALEATRTIIEIAGPVVAMGRLRKASREMQKLEINPTAGVPQYQEHAEAEADEKKTTSFKTREFLEAITEVVSAYRTNFDKCLVKPVEGYKIEVMTHQSWTLDYLSSSEADEKIALHAYMQAYRLEHIDDDAEYYRKFFVGQDHRTYIGKSEAQGISIISIIYEGADGGGQYRAIVRQKQVADIRLVIPASEVGHTSKVRKPAYRNVLRLLRMYAAGAKFRRTVEPSVEKKVLAMDELQVTKRYKFGILYCKSGQTTEDEMFGNEHGSPSFANFLRVLGEQVSLKDFKGFAAGLDCKNGQTGGHTVWSLWRNYECTFHVSTMLPYNADDPQQIQRKRHIGNDLVCVVFLDGNGSAFDPLCIHSQFLHVFIVVSEEARETMDELDSPVYRVTVTSNLEVPTFGPPLPSPPLFYNAYTLREFIFAKMINGENAAYKSSRFLRPHTRTRNALFDDIVKEALSGKEKDPNLRKGSVSDRSIGSIMSIDTTGSQQLRSSVTSHSLQTSGPPSRRSSLFPSFPLLQRKSSTSGSPVGNRTVMEPPTSQSSSEEESVDDNRSSTNSTSRESSQKESRKGSNADSRKGSDAKAPPQAPAGDTKEVEANIGESEERGISKRKSTKKQCRSVDTLVADQKQILRTNSIGYNGKSDDGGSPVGTRTPKTDTPQSISKRKALSSHNLRKSHDSLNDALCTASSGDDINSSRKSAKSHLFGSLSFKHRRQIKTGSAADLASSKENVCKSQTESNSEAHDT